MKRTPFILLALAVAIGAFGAHGLKPYLVGHSEEVFRTASRYHFYHGLGILILVLYDLRAPSPIFRPAIIWLTLGTIFFSGSLYLLALPGEWMGGFRKILGPITPIGGICLIIGWLIALFRISK